MGIKTEDMCKGIPPKEPKEGVDWLGILDGFDPKPLPDRYINECARRNPYYTCYKWEEDGLAKEPIEARLKNSERHVEYERKELTACVDRINSEGVTNTNYKLARAALIKAIGTKGAAEYNRREYERLGEEGRARQIEEYKQWQENREKQRAAEEAEYEEMVDSDLGYYYEEPVASMHEKIVRIRKGMVGTDGKPLTQRNFAKLLGYPINKYAEAEKIDRWHQEKESEVEYELLEKLVMIAHANPYWLFDDETESYYAEYDMGSDAVLEGDEPCVYAKPDVILKWIEEGKPRSTSWEESVVWDLQHRYY